MKFFLFFFIFILIGDTHASQKRKVLVIGIAGVRSDALQKANTPSMNALIANGFYTYESWHRGITLSAPAWSTLMCGVEYNKHGVTSNSYAGSNYTAYPYFPTRAKSCSPNLYAVQIVQWAPMSDNVYNDGWDKKIKVQYGIGSQSVAAAQTELANSNLDLLFICFDECDVVGHSTGFSPTNTDYIAALETVDGHIGSVITALRNRVDYANEDWIVLITTDYGGIGTGHGGNSVQERKIWWMGSGNSPVSKQLTGVKDPGSVSIGNYNPILGAQSPGEYDIAVTALDHLLRGSSCNPTINPAWNLDGRSWLDSLHVEETGGIIFTDSKINVKLYPNPAPGIVSLYFENEKSEPVSYRVTNMTGIIISEGKNTGSKNKLTLDLSKKPKGVYSIELTVGLNKIIKQLLLN